MSLFKINKNILLMDIGNTNISSKIIYENNHSPIEINDNSIDIKSIFETMNKKNHIDLILFSSVVPKITIKLEKFAILHKIELLNITEIKNDLKFNVQNPKEIGSDLIGTACGTSLIGNAIIFDLGTAITATFLKNNNFVGVNISLGISQIAETLSTKTALLSLTKMTKPKVFIGTNTKEAISNGIYASTIGFINENIKIAQNYFKSDFKIYGTGNGFKLFDEFIDNLLIDSELIFKGMLNIYRKDQIDQN
jgi:pantothenate kinase type III